MLNRVERFKILKIIYYCCTIGCFPVTVDLPTWQLLSYSQSGKQRWPNVAYFTCFLFQVLYKLATFFRACFVYKNTPLHELTIHGVMVLGGAVVLLWYYLMFVKHSGVFGAYLQITLTGNIGGTLVQDQMQTNWKNRFKQYNLRDLFAISLPYMVAAVVPAYFMACICYPNLQLLLYAGLPDRYQTWLSFTILIVEEMRYMITFCVIAVPMWTLQLISFDVINTRLKLLIHSIERATSNREFHLIYSYLRHFQLYITIINSVNRYLIFSWKVYSITICIGTGYAAIAHFTDHPLFGILYYIILIDCTVIYTVIYGKAFKTPELFEEARQKALLRRHQVSYQDMITFKRQMRSVSQVGIKWKVTKKALLLRSHLGAHRDAQTFRRQMRSVPRVGIKVGDFHMMERNSVLIFMHYVLSNIVTLLVAYKH